MAHDVDDLATVEHAEVTRQAEARCKLRQHRRGDVRDVERAALRGQLDDAAAEHVVRAAGHCSIKPSASSVCSSRSSVVRLIPSARAAWLWLATDLPAAMCRSTLIARTTGGTV